MSDHDEDLENLEDWLRRLKIEYDVFFNGNRKRAPEDLRARVEKIVHRLSEAADMSYSQRFRYNTLVTSFYVYRDLWRRTLLEREGVTASPRKSEYGPSAAPGVVAASPPQVLSVSISDPGASQQEIRAIYEALSTLNPKQPGGAGRLPFDRFSQYISERVRAIKEKYHCHRVLFSVSLEDDAIRFTAKPEM